MTELISPLAAGTESTFGLTKFLDPLRVPPRIRSRWHQDELTITAVRTTVQLHSQLPRTEVWAYEGGFPGPTIEVASGKQIRVSWTNEIEGTIPLTAVHAPIETAPFNSPGYRNPDGSLPPGVGIIDGVADLPSWTVVHLHGARTGGGNDGWAHNAVLKGASQLTEYPNEQPSTTLWYHDHAMAITRYNVYAGLAGMYLIRDEEEDDLDLPRGEHEVPLIITDRNLDTELDGSLSGRLLYKVPSAVTPAGGVGTLPFSGPFTLVNGKIWPHMDTEARWYRFRVLNASNARFYTLNLIDEAGNLTDAADVPYNDAIRQIGTDGGLLPEPAPLPDGGLTIAPAERADLLIDFSRFPGRRLRLTNTHLTAAPERDIMEFRVEDRPRLDFFELPDRISESFVRLEHGTTLPDDHDHVYVAMVPPGSAGEVHPQMWELRELTDPAEIPTTFPTSGVIQLTDPHSGKIRTFERVATLFDDTTTLFFNHGRWVVWNLINLGGPDHPLHIHLAEFQALSRKQYATVETPVGLVVTGFDVEKGGTTAPLPVPPDGRPLDKQEQGWKDTYQLAPGEMLTVAGHFDGGTGSFMYHCHILDHEDEGMMRPFVVMPAEAARFHVHRFSGGHGHGA
ncbi:multicopper oxidase family protein [Actinokineospora iranica]|uniref:Multicopper oxidase with three cupredoxin domains (Includes cell division protein FtsP and spore coat protein CotA) n=1 Tax=Actinokineospora iranica TaxID=1271860 RepID=A0A1G6T9F4_9PSEU|nr:multicopper oxidase domain-containing protein [Actinokineospora iranica]SDD25653.1 Multicopper oxidase with three cupredoxin domains (includes cell division protein FtsP and spore coat protein CotA) [Actinokineospora iranica]